MCLSIITLIKTSPSHLRGGINERKVCYLKFRSELTSHTLSFNFHPLLVILHPLLSHYDWLILTRFLNVMLHASVIGSKLRKCLSLTYSPVQRCHRLNQYVVRILYIKTTVCFHFFKLPLR